MLKGVLHNLPIKSSKWMSAMLFLSRFQARTTLLLAVFFSFSLLGFGSAAAKDEKGYQAQTATPGLSDTALELRLIPLTQEELAVESEAWMQLAKKKNIEVMDNKIARENADGEAIAKLENEMVSLLSESKDLSSKFQLVVDQWELKGGDAEKIEEYRQYIAVVYMEGVKSADVTVLLEAVKEWLLSSEGGGKLAVKIGILVLAWLGLVVLSRFVARAVKKGISRISSISQLMTDFLVKTSRMATIVIGILIVLSMFGVEMGPLFALIGGASFIIAFAMQSTLSNFAAGLMIMIYQPFDVDDLVTLAGVTGKVKEMNLVSTTIVTLDNQQIIIPNSNAWGSIITNINRSSTRRVDLIFGIGYEDDMEKAQKVIENVVNEHPLVLKNPEPVVRVHELADSSVNYVCRPWVNSDDYWTVYWDVTRGVKERFDAEGISIPYPQQDVHVHKTG